MSWIMTDHLGNPLAEPERVVLTLCRDQGPNAPLWHLQIGDLFFDRLTTAEMQQKLRNMEEAGQ